MLLWVLSLVSTVAAASSNAMMRSGLPLRDASADAPPTDGARIVIVSLEARVHGRSRNLLSKWLPGAVIGNYIAHDSFAVLATPDDVLSAAAHPAIAHVGALDPEHKVSPSLLSGLGRARAARAYVRLWEMRMRTPSLPLTGILRRWRGSGGVLRRVAGWFSGVLRHIADSPVRCSTWLVPRCAAAHG